MAAACRLRSKLRGNNGSLLKKEDEFALKQHNVVFKTSSRQADQQIEGQVHLRLRSGQSGDLARAMAGT